MHKIKINKSSCNFRRNFDNISEKFEIIKNYIVKTGVERFDYLNEYLNETQLKL